ncbi:MAG: N-acetyl-gamma-glutamyl-phosphate reductase [Acidobacteria bacterium]|nr:N-acetyl-gamma-glutamyl-phosphate reductase [Acidobacteriota bacterium]
MVSGNGTDPAGVVVLGASGYVAGELLRWVAGHPGMRLAGAVSASHPGLPITESFPNLAASFPEETFVPPGDLAETLAAAAAEHSGLAAFSAAPHKASAPQVAALLAAADAAGCDLPVVDLSADFRHADPARYQEIYGIPHPEPGLLAEFTCGLPELAGDDTGGGPGRVAHPGCFATAVALAAAPLRRAGLVEPELHVSAVTGSTGSGGMPKETTHHPLRHANLFAYKPLQHRHAPEMEDLLAAPGERPARVRFVPHSGPFARGIHATVFAKSRSPLSAASLDAAFRDFYAGAPLVRIASAPRLKEAVGSATTVVGATTDGETVVAFAALDNLGKGAASGGVQWMNLLLGFPETAGLTVPPPAWL